VYLPTYYPPLFSFVKKLTKLNDSSFVYILRILLFGSVEILKKKDKWLKKERNMD